jgi:gag-polypeptide of LTR copia-type/Zinc knuckle
MPPKPSTAAEDKGGKLSGLLGKVNDLNAGNYHNWRFAISMVLRRADLWDLLTAEGDDADDERAAKKNASKMQEILTAIGLTVDESQYIYIRDADNGYEAWKALEKVYLKNSRANRISLKRQLYGFRHAVDNPIQDYINGILELTGQLRGIGVRLDKTEIMDILIMNLHESWSSMASTLATTITDAQSVEDVTGALIDEDCRRHGGATGNSGDVAMMASRGRTRRANDPRRCYNCGEPGHLSRNCPKRKDSDKKADTASFAATEKDFDIAY